MQEGGTERSPPGRRPLTGTAPLAARGADVAEVTEAPAQACAPVPPAIAIGDRRRGSSVIVDRSNNRAQQCCCLPCAMVAMIAFVAELGARVLALACL